MQRTSKEQRKAIKRQQMFIHPIALFSMVDSVDGMMVQNLIHVEYRRSIAIVFVVVVVLELVNDQ